MKGNLAIALPEKLSKKVKNLQKSLGLKTPGEVIVKAISLLELSMGRKVKMSDNDESIEINSFKGLRQSIKIETLEQEKEDKD